VSVHAGYRYIGHCREREKSDISQESIRETITAKEASEREIDKAKGENPV
jgi:hypothetical protein